MVRCRPRTPWFTAEIGQAKRKRRQLERKWRKAKTDENHRLYTSQCRVVDEMIKTAKEIYFSSVVDDNKSDQRILFTSIDTLLYRKPVSRYPSSTSDEVLANRFNSFFLEKINTIRSGIIGSSDAYIPCPPLAASFGKCELLCFQPFTQDHVSKI